MRRWLEIAVTVPEEAADAVSERLVGWGAPGVVEEGEGTTRRIVGHFPEDAHGRAGALAAFLEEIAGDFPGAASGSIETRLVDEEDWAEGWRQGFPPLEIGERLRIRPPWVDPSADGRIDVVIEPAMAFGTGQHATTLGCLIALEEIAGASRPARVLDLGTGSGILAIAALRLGARDVVGVDVDPVAVDAARENARRNGVVDAIELEVGDLELAPGGPYDVVLANLYSGVLATLFPALARRLDARGVLIASGFLEIDADDVARAAEASGLGVRSRRTIDGWTTLLLEGRRGAAS